MTTLGDALRLAQAQGLDRLDAQLLLLHALGQDSHDRAWLLAHDADALSMIAESRLTPLVARRAAGEPLAYITGRREFFGLDLEVNPNVLIPPTRHRNLGRMGTRTFAHRDRPAAARA